MTIPKLTKGKSKISYRHDEIVRLYKAGETTISLGVQFNVSPNAIWGVLRQNSVEIRPAGFQKGNLNPSKKPERRKAISEWRKKQTLSSVTKQRISASMKRALQNPKLRERWRENATGRKLAPETITKMVKTRRKNHPLSRRGLVGKLDNLHSKYVRLLNMNGDGKIKCFTCSKLLDYSAIDCGHYISRIYMATRWMLENTAPQCRSCNRFHEGVKDVFALNLQEKYGMDILQKLNDRKNEIKKFSIPDLEELESYYIKEIKGLEGGI